MKLLVWDGSGLVLLWKRLESGVIQWPPVADGVMRLPAAQAGGVAGRSRLDADARAAPCTRHRGLEDQNERLRPFIQQRRIRLVRLGVGFDRRLPEVLERQIQLFGIELLRPPPELHALQLAATGAGPETAAEPLRLPDTCRGSRW